MTTEERVMTILERTNPVPPTTVVDASIGADRYLEDLQQRSSTMSMRSTETPTTRRRWAMVGAAAVIVALVVVAAFVVGGDGDDNIIVDTPDSVPATIPTTSAVSPDSPQDAQAAVDAFFAAYNTGDLEVFLAMMSDEAIGTVQYDSGVPNPDRESVAKGEIELTFAWNAGQGEVWTEPNCRPADVQRAAGMTLSCQWDTLDSLIQAVEGDPVATDALIVVAAGRIVELHLGYGTPDFASLGRPFTQWLGAYHPEAAAAGADCCAGDTREESIERGELRAQWAQNWATFLQERGCEPTSCPFALEDWVAVYDAQCLALESPNLPGQDLVERTRGLPPPPGNILAATRLFDADAALQGPGLTDERIADLQQQRLAAMIELGIDERCRPTIG